MVDGTAVAALQTALNKPHMIEVDGRERLVVPVGWQEMKYEHPTPAPIVIGTLTGVVHYLKTNVDKAELANTFVHVMDHGTVQIRGNLEGEATKFRRVTPLIASTALVGAIPFKFGDYLDAESFFIGLQAAFVQDEARDELLTFIAAIRENTVKDTFDDGVAQSVNVAGGVKLVGPKNVPNPVTLRPFRTFREIQQPASRFILRAQSGGPGDKPKLGLFEADGSAWKLTAVSDIASWLSTKFTEANVTVAVVA